MYQSYILEGKPGEEELNEVEEDLLTGFDFLC